MPSTPILQPLSTGPAPRRAAAGRLVTDAPTRMFHWLFALSFVGAYVSAESEHWRALHVTLGYTMAGLLVFRVVYGLFGPRQAGLGMLLRKLSSGPTWLRTAMQAVQRRSLAGIQWRQGQNLMMALAIVLLLVMVVPLTLSGYATYNEWGDFLGGDWIGEVHEFFGETFLVVVLGHLALIAGLSVLRRKNQAAPMLTGRVDGPGPDLVKNSHTWLAVLLLACVFAFAAWEWQQAPNGLIPSQAWSASASGDRGDEDD